MAPFGQAVGFIKHPAANLPGGENFSHRAIAKLFRRNVKDTDVPHGHPVHDHAPFRRREKSTDGGSGHGACAGVEIVHLVFHQGLEGGDHNGEAAGVEIACQGRDLKADGFSTPGGQNGKQRGSCKTVGDNVFLKGGAVGKFPVGGESKEPGQVFHRIMGGGAMGAGFV